MGLNATFHSVHFPSTAQADFGNVGQYALLLHGIHTPGKYLGNRTISSNFSSTQYNPIVNAFLGARNVDIYCRQSRVSTAFMTGQKNTSVSLSLFTVHFFIITLTQKTTCGLVGPEVQTNHYDVTFGCQ